MFFRKAALRKVPRYAVVDAHIIESLEGSLDNQPDALQDALDRGYAELDRRQPTLTEWMAEELSSTEDELVQSLGYFLSVTVYMAFREAFPTRLAEIGPSELQLAEDLLAADEELRAADPTEVLDSDDLLAMDQPSVLAFVKHHVDEALQQGDEGVNFEELDRIYRAMLVQVIALSHAVRSPTGELGPPREALA